MSCKYYNNEQLKELITKEKKNNGLSLLHMNISSLPYHIDEFKKLLNELNSNFKIIGITESRLTTKKDPLKRPPEG